MQQSILEIKRRLARLLVEKSYREGDFVLASGRRSDYYFDCRVTALHAEGSWLIGTLFNDLLKDVPVVGVGGMTMGADPLVSATTAISHELGRPLNGLLVRKEAKDHGTGQFVEGLGNFKPGDKVAMLEDVVTTGGSLLKACTNCTPSSPARNWWRWPAPRGVPAGALPACSGRMAGLPRMLPAPDPSRTGDTPIDKGQPSGCPFFACFYPVQSGSMVRTTRK